MIYLDYNATTPIARMVSEAMVAIIYDNFGNPSSAHPIGKKAKKALEKARTQISGVLGCKTGEIIFTGGGTESNNMVLKSVAWTLRNKGKHIITTKIEHPSIITMDVLILMR